MPRKAKTEKPVEQVEKVEAPATSPVEAAPKPKAKVRRVIEKVEAPKPPDPTEGLQVEDWEDDDGEPPAALRGEVEAPPAEKPVETPEAVEKVEEPPAPKHPHFLVEMARDLGASDEAIAGASADELAAYIRGAHRKPAAVQEVAKPEPEPEIDLGLDEAEYDPKLIGAIKKVVGEQAKEIRTLRSQQQASEQREQVRTAKDGERQLDNVFTTIDRPDLFGKGSIENLAGKARECRQFVMMSLQNRPIKGKPLAEQIKLRTEELFGSGKPGETPNRIAALNGKPKLTEEQQEWVDGGLELPTNRVPAKPKRGNLAAKEAFLKANQDNGRYLGTPLERDEDDGF